MHGVWCGVALLILSSAAKAQAGLTGYVRDEESLRGLPGVELSIDGSDKKFRTDKDGKYNLRDLTAGSVRVHVRLVGFAPIDTIVTLAADKPTENVFFLGKHAVRLDTWYRRPDAPPAPASSPSRAGDPGASAISSTRSRSGRTRTGSCPR